MEIERIIIMYPTGEQLEAKWWHRLMRVLRWVLTIGILVFFAFLSFDGYDRCLRYKWGGCNENLLIGLLFTLAFALTTYFVFWLIYKKIILYIVFGKKNK